MIQIITDSCADLSQELLSDYGILSIPLHVLIKGIDYHDNDLPLGQLFSSVDETGELPKTAAPSVQEFIEFFDSDNSVIYIGLSSQLSATMQNAALAAEQLKKSDIFLIDSLNLSTGIGLLVLKAVDLMCDGKNAAQIINEIESISSKVKTAFVIDKMEYLYKGGRCTGMQAFVGSMLKIHPVIHVRQDGSLGVLDKVRGNRKKTLDRLLSGFKADLPDIDSKRVFVTHSGCEEDANYLADNLNEMAEIENIHITVAGATIGSHCGPNTIGILYITK